MEKRRCSICRKLYPVCDLDNHPIYGLICKDCYEERKKEIDKHMFG